MVDRTSRNPQDHPQRLTKITVKRNKIHSEKDQLIMAMETVTNYTCDRCGRSEIRDRVTILTLTIRERTSGTPGQGKSMITKHVCQQNCLKIVTASMTPVNKPGQYDRAAAAKRRAATKAATNSTSVTTTHTKDSTKKPRTPRTAKITPAESPSTTETRADVVRAVRKLTRTPQGGWAKGHNYHSERRMIAERESNNA